MAMTSVSLQLLDLLPEILFKLLREYVSFQEKLYTLWEIPEFHPYLQDADAWITSSKIISFPFLNWIRTVKLGWYIHRENRSHRLLLQLDPLSMTLSLHHFFMDYHLSFSPSPKRVMTCQKTLDRMQSLFQAYLEDYVFIPTMDMCTFHLKPDGRLLIEDDWEKEDQNKMRFYDWEECFLSFYAPIIMQDVAGKNHFKVLLTYDRTLTVECLFPPGKCRCKKRILHLLPISWQVKEDRLKGIDGALIPKVACHTLQGVDKAQVHSEMKYYLSTLYSDIVIETGGAFHE